MKTFKQFIKEDKKNEFWHSSIAEIGHLRPGMHIGTEEQARTRFSDRTEHRKDLNMHMYHITEKNPRKPEEYIEIEDSGNPTLGQALSRAAKDGRIPENIARIARKKSTGEQARVLMKHGIHRVKYQNKYEGSGKSHIIVNPDDFEMKKVDQ